MDRADGRFEEEFSYSQVMEVDGRVELSGQGGWHPETLNYPAGVPIETEVGRAFDNVDFMLKAVGLDWFHVAHVDSYHVPEANGQILAATAEVVRQFRLRMPNHKPIWTSLGVLLGDPGMRVEVRVTAFRELRPPIGCAVAKPKIQGHLGSLNFRRVGSDDD